MNRLYQPGYEHYHQERIHRMENVVGEMVPEGIQSPNGII
jgi:hypothetical protein